MPFILGPPHDHIWKYWVVIIIMYSHLALPSVFDHTPFLITHRKRMSASQCLEHMWMKGRKANLNSSTSSLDSALGNMDSPSSVEPSPASSTSSSFSPAPSSTTHSNATTSMAILSDDPLPIILAYFVKCLICKTLK